MAEHWGIKDVYCLPVENNAALLTLVSTRSKSIVIEMIAKVHQCLHVSRDVYLEHINRFC